MLFKITEYLSWGDNYKKSLYPGANDENVQKMLDY